MTRAKRLSLKISRVMSRFVYSFFLDPYLKKVKFFVIYAWLTFLKALKIRSINLEFLVFLSSYQGKSYSQFRQDLFALFISKNWTERTFIEIGVGDGIEISNTYLLESEYKWNGVLVEPNRMFVDSIRNLRSAKHIEAALTTHDIGEVEFFTGKRGVFASLLPTGATNKQSSYRVKSIPVSEVFGGYQKDDLALLSLDIEGKEDEIVIALMKMNCRPYLIVVEHNYDQFKAFRIKQSLIANDYTLLCENISEVDYWFVRNDKINP